MVELRYEVRRDHGDSRTRRNHEPIAIAAPPSRCDWPASPPTQRVARTMMNTLALSMAPCASRGAKKHSFARASRAKPHERRAATRHRGPSCVTCLVTRRMLGACYFRFRFVVRFVVRFFRPPLDFRFDGTFAPFFRASESPIAIACFLLFTLPPFPPLPLRSVPFFRFFIALSTLLPAAFPYFRVDFLRVLFFRVAMSDHPLS